MPKRKREPPASAEARRKQDIEDGIVSGRKLLNKALKLARSFERQKLDKRIKLATKEEDKVDRLRKEFEALRALDVSKVIDAHLFRTLLRTKSIASSNLLPDYVTLDVKNEIAPQQDALAVGNVTARLYNEKHVKDAMAQVMRTMYAAVGARPGTKGTAEDGKPKEQPLRRPKPAYEHEQDIDIASDVSEDDDGGSDNEALKSREAAWEGFDSGFENSVGEDTMGKYDEQIAQSSQEDSEADEEVTDWNKIRKAAGITLNQAQKHTRIAASPPPSGSSLSSSASSPPPPAAKKKKKAPEARPTGSQFLPTLMGGYWSGSEESATDVEEDEKPKKNRRGQRERRLIAERKFGKAAAHLKKGLPSVQDRDSGWDPKRGAREAPAGRGSGRRGGRERAGGDSDRKRPVKVSATGENATELGPSKRAPAKKDDAGILHPSWAAAKKAKDEKKAAAFQGKKVVFD